MKLVSIDCSKITDWSSFHQVFKEALGFPDFYGNNMNAWIDCLSSLDVPEHGMTNIHISEGEILTLQLKGAKEFILRCPEQYAAIIECSAFVNYRQVEKGLDPLLSLAFNI